MRYFLQLMVDLDGKAVPAMLGLAHIVSISPDPETKQALIEMGNGDVYRTTDSFVEICSKIGALWSDEQIKGQDRAP